MTGTGPNSGFWGGTVWGLLISSLIVGFSGEVTGMAVLMGSAVIAAAIRGQR